MIATRRNRTRHFPFKRILGLFVAAGIGYALVREPVTNKLIFDGPAKPMWKQVSVYDKKFVKPVTDPLTAPFSFAAQQQKLRDRAKEIADLQAQLADVKTQSKAATSENQTLRRRVDTLTKMKTPAVPAAAIAPAANAPGITANATSGGVGTGSTAQQQAAVATVTPSPDEQKTATYWTAMDSENAAAIAQKLDPQESARIFSAMKPEQAAEIMDALPAAYNVKLQAVHLSYVRPSAQSVQ